MIGAISNNRNIQTMAQGKNDTSKQEISALEHQKSAIQKQIDDIKNGDGDTKSKQQLIQPLQQQIEQIDAEIQQKQMDNVSDKNDHSSSTANKVSKNSNKISEQGNSEYSVDALLINSSNMYKQIKTVTSVKNGLIRKADVLNSDAKFDELVHNYKGAEIRRSQASEAKVRAVSLQSKEGKLINKVNKDVKNVIEGVKGEGNSIKTSFKVNGQQVQDNDVKLGQSMHLDSNDSKDDENKSINVLV